MDFEQYWNDQPSFRDSDKESVRKAFMAVQKFYEDIFNSLGICSDCKQHYRHSIDEPIANCDCKQSEWYTLTPYMKLEAHCKELYIAAGINQSEDGKHH